MAMWNWNLLSRRRSRKLRARIRAYTMAAR